MAKIGEAELKAQIKSGEYSNVYLIYGEESYLKEHYVEVLKKKIVDGAFADFNFHRYEGKTTNINEILQDAEMMPMMADYSFILVHDYPLDKSSADVDSLKEFFKDVPQTCILVFWYDSIEVDTKKNSKWKTIETAFAKAGSAVNLEKRTESDLVKLIISSAKKRGSAIDNVNARYLISVVGSDIKTIFNELEKICGYVGEGEITKKDIDTLAVKCLQARVYDLSKFILQGNSDGAYNVLNVLFAQKEEPISILAVISSCYIDMYRAKCAKAANENEMTLSDYFSYKGREFLIRNAARDCRNISFESLRKAIDILSNTDELLKSTSIDKNLLLEETVAKLLMLRNL
jgi:DNA polymerase-3 subunit delta